MLCSCMNLWLLFTSRHLLIPVTLESRALSPCVHQPPSHHPKYSCSLLHIYILYEEQCFIQQIDALSDHFLSLSSYLISFILCPFIFGDFSGFDIYFSWNVFPDYFSYSCAYPHHFTNSSIFYFYFVFIFLSPGRKRSKVMRGVIGTLYYIALWRWFFVSLETDDVIQKRGRSGARASRVDYVFPFTLGWLDGLPSSKSPAPALANPTEKFAGKKKDCCSW